MISLQGNVPGDSPESAADPRESIALPRPRVASVWLLAVLVASLAPIAKSIVERLAR
jgi:hypothetical protein